MSDVISIMNAMRRPKLLLQAARHGLQDYNRERVLKRLIKSSAAPSPRSAMNTLLPVEANLEDARRAGDATYSVSRHVEVLIALLAEMRLINNAKARI